MAQYTIYNGASPTTAKQVPVATGTAIKTHVQVQASGTILSKIIAWGVQTTAPASTGTISVELLETNVAATSLTAHVAAGIVRVDPAAIAGGDPTTNLIQVGTSATGWSAGAEGSITATRMFDSRWATLSSAAGYEYSLQFPLGREPHINIALFGRIRIHTSVTVDAICWMTVEV
jgi:hypothetical protein